MKKFFMICALFLLCACEKKALECNDPKLADLIKQIVWDSVRQALPDQEMLLTQEQVKSRIRLDYARPTKYEPDIKRYSCAGTVIFEVAGAPELQKTFPSFKSLEAARKKAVRTPLRYNAFSILTDHAFLLNEISSNSNPAGYSFKTEFFSQKVGDDDFAEIALSKANTLSIFVLAALSENGTLRAEEPADASPQQSGSETEESPYELSGQEKGIISRALENFRTTYKDAGVPGAINERDQCYRAAAGIKDMGLTVQCIAYDYAAASAIGGVETAHSFPKTEGMTTADVRIRALESIENSVTDTLQTTKARETFLKAVLSEAEQKMTLEADTPSVKE